MKTFREKIQELGIIVVGLTFIISVQAPTELRYTMVWVVGNPHSTSLLGTEKTM